MKRSLVLLIGLLVVNCSTDSENESIVDSTQMTMEAVDASDNDANVELKGTFIDGAHPTSGTATVRADKKTVQLNEFKTDAGPLLEFYLATDLDGLDYVTLGELQGLEGDYIYDIPDGVNFETHKYLMVWCVDFKVNFGHAVLE